MPQTLRDIHLRFLNRVQARCQLAPVALKHPLPERPLRSLGLIKIDGQAFSSHAFMRVLVLTTNFLVSSRCSRSLFLGPHLNLHLPIFSSETIIMGGKTAFLVDIHSTVHRQRFAALRVEERLFAIREKYPELFAEPIQLPGKIADIMSRAHCYIRIPPELDGRALELFDEYLDFFLEIAERAAPVAGDQLRQAQDDYQNYKQTVLDHDPAVKIYSMLFGKSAAVARVKDLFFAC